MADWSSELNAFQASLTTRFKALQDDISKEVDRLATSRDVHWKKELQASRRENQDLRAKLEILKKQATQAEVVKNGEDNTLRENSQSSEQEVLNSEGIDNKMTTVSIDSPPAMLLEDLTTDLGTMSEAKLTGSERQKIGEHFEFWEEWKPEVDPGDRSARLQSKASMEDLLDKDDDEDDVDWRYGLEHEMSESRYRCTVDPHSVFSMYWQLASIPILAYDLAIIPLQAFYEETSWQSKVLSWSITLYWTSDLFLHLFVIGFVSKRGVVHLQRRLIMKNYLRTSFFFDLLLVAPDWLSLLQFKFLRNVAALRAIKLFRLLRLTRMTKLQRTMRDVNDMVDSEYVSIIIAIACNIIFVVGCCHYLGCFWFWVGNRGVPGYPSWVEEFEIADRDWEFQYLQSLFWAITQFTPASCRIQPRNIPETLVAFVVLLFGMVFFSVFISSITSHRMRLQAITSKLDRDNWMLRRYLRQHGVSPELTIRCIQYVDVAVAPQMQNVQRKDVSLLTHLSRPLQAEVQADMFCRTLLVHPLLARLRQQNIVWSSHLFADVVSETSLAHTDQLFEVGQASRELYFTSRGTLAYLMRGSRQVEHLRLNSWCCEQSLWVPWVHKGTAKAAQECHLISINTKKFRGSVLERRERASLRLCAKAYVDDLNSYVDAGKVISDTTCISDDVGSEYGKSLQVVFSSARTALFSSQV